MGEGDDWNWSLNVINEIIISVIVPIYNAEQFLDRAIRSVLCQMDGNVELILVDDGSTDGSGAICDAYAADNSNIRVIHKENGGTSSAKNMGIQIATGRYITFMDSDDYLEPTAYGEIRDVIEQYEPDCIDFGWRYVSNGEPLPPAFHKLLPNTLLGEEVLTEQILPPLLNLRHDPDHFIFDFCWNKVFRADNIHRYGIRFDVDKRVWEDRTFLLRCLRYSKTYYAMDRCFYNYVDVPGSLSRRYSMDFFRIILENFRHYSELFGDQFDFDTQYVNDYWCHAIENMIFRSLEQKENTEQIRQNILDTLADEQVVHWYAKRDPENAFEKKMSSLIISRQGEKAYLEYIRTWKKQLWKDAVKVYGNVVKQAVKKVLSR